MANILLSQYDNLILVDLLKDALKELDLIRQKDGAGPYDPTLRIRLMDKIYDLSKDTECK